MVQKFQKKERDLINSIIKGNISDFSILIEPYYEKLYLKVLSMIKDPNDAYDVLQEALISAYNSLKKFKGNSSIYTWLYRIAVNKSIDFVKQKKKQNKILQIPKNPYDDREDNFSSHSSKNMNVQQNYEQKELFETLINIIEKMDEKYKEILIMRYFDDLSYEEIAEIKQIKLGTVKSRLNKAKEILKKKLSYDGNFFLQDMMVIIFFYVIYIKYIEFI